jgi:hypothetical protein
MLCKWSDDINTNREGVHVCDQFNILDVDIVQWKTTVNQQQSVRFHKRHGSSLLSDSILAVQEELCTLALILRTLIMLRSCYFKLLWFLIKRQYYDLRKDCKVVFSLCRL